jgi:chloride channel 7
VFVQRLNFILTTKSTCFVWFFLKVEITNDIEFLLPIMASLLIARAVGDSLTHSFYHCLIEVKCLPFIGNEEPIVYDEKGQM